MNKNITRVLLATVLAMTAITGMAENRLYLKNFSIKPGEVKEVQFYLETEQGAINCQFELVLPEGLVCDDGSGYGAYFEIDNGRAPELRPGRKQPHTVSWNETVCHGDGETPCVRVVIKHDNNLEFTGNEGSILTTWIMANDQYVETSQIELRDVIVGHTSSEKLIDYETFFSKAYVKVPMANLAEYNGKEVAIDEAMGVAIVAGDKAFATDGNENWMQVQLDEAVVEDMAEITTLESGAVMGVYNDGVNPYMTAVETPVQAENEVEVVVKDYNLANDLFAPKANEVLNVTGCYQDNALTGYSDASGQSVAIRNDWMVGDVPSLTAKGQYKFSNCVAQLKEAWEAEDAAGAPARVKASDAGAAANVEIYPLTYPDVMTAVTDINVSKAVSVKYYNAAGVASDKAFDGINIVVTKNADGSQTVSKVVK